MSGWVGWEPNQTKDTFKSTEQNATIYAAFSLLYQVTQNEQWRDNAEWAFQFLSDIAWNQTEQFFFSGTTSDGITPNETNHTLDPNILPLLAIENRDVFQNAIQWNALNCGLESDGFQGFDFNTDKDGIWFEGTAQMVQAYLALGQNESASVYVDELIKAQNEALNTNGFGIISASHDDVTTGWGYQYFAAPSVGATSWYALANLGLNQMYLKALDEEVVGYKAKAIILVDFEGENNDTPIEVRITFRDVSSRTLVNFPSFQDLSKKKRGIQLNIRPQESVVLHDIPSGFYQIVCRAKGFKRKVLKYISIESSQEPIVLDFGILKRK